MKRGKQKRFTRRLSLTFSDGKVTYSGITSNLSESGLFVRTRNAFHPGTSVKIVLEVDENRKITLDGKVAWSLKTGISDFKNGMGIRLTTIPQAYKDLVKELLYD